VVPLKKVGIRSLGVKLGINQLKEAELPCILHWRQNHFFKRNFNKSR